LLDSGKPVKFPSPSRAAAKGLCETSFHGGVWQKSGASKNRLRRPPNVRYLLRSRNIRDSTATIFN
jgi:hypothetical protein